MDRAKTTTTKAEKVRGWKTIAAALEVDPFTAMKWAKRGKLTVRVDHKGVYMYADVLSAFLAAQDRSYTDHVAARKPLAS